MSRSFQKTVALDEEEELQGTSSDSSISEDSTQESQDAHEVRGTSMPQAVFNIVKNIVGEGMLSLPAGVAAGTGLALAVTVVTIFGLMLGYTFSEMGRACHTTGMKTHKGCAEALSGPILAQAMAIVCALKTACTCLAYGIVLGDSFSSILHFFGLLDPFWTSRQVVLIVIVVLVLLPLALQRDLSALAFTSLIGVCGEIFVVSSMTVRFADGSYASPDGQFWNSTKPKDHPDFSGGVDYWHTSLMSFVLLGSLSTAFMAHYNGPKFYSQLTDATPRRFGVVVGIGFLIAWAIYVWIMTVGYLTFGEACEGLILNNYSEKDPLATAARVAIGFAVMFGFPLSFVSLRDNTASALGLDDSNTAVFYGLTLVLLTTVTLSSCYLHDLGLVNSLTGAVLCSCLSLVFPGMLAYLASRQKGHMRVFSKTEGTANLALVAFGVVLLIFGTAVNVIKKFYPNLLGH